MASSTALQAGKFSLVGIFNTLLDILLLNILRRTTKLSLTASSYVSSSITMVVSFFLNRAFVFNIDQSHPAIGGEAIKFIIATVIGIWVIHNGVIWILENKNRYLPELAVRIVRKIKFLNFLGDRFVFDNSAKAFGILASFMWNFLLYKYWVFA